VKRIADAAQKEWETLHREMRELCGHLAEDLAAQRADAARYGVGQDAPPQDDDNLSASAKLRRTMAEMQARLQRQRDACEEGQPGGPAKEALHRPSGAVLAPATPPQPNPAPPMSGHVTPPPPPPAAPAPWEAGAKFDGGGYM